jgi:2,4-dienoyl-CoA reductase (NADPH2)
MIGEGTYTFRNYLAFRWRFLRPLARWLWNRTRGDVIEGINVEDARAVKSAVTIPVLVTGGFQTASYIRQVLRDGSCDGVTIARPLLANPDLLAHWAAGKDVPNRPCTYSNKCLVNVLEHPLGCYDETRYASYDEMIRDVMAFYEGTDDLR